MTQREAEELLAASQPPELMDAATYEEYCYNEADYRAEHEAETAWLSYAESRGWEEAWLEEMIEAGFRARW